MSPNVSHWLAEIQSLQRQVADLQQEKEQAYASVDNWRRLYEAEAQQRRREAAANIRRVEQLQQALDEQPSSHTEESSVGLSTDGVEEIREGHSVRALRIELAKARAQCQQLQALLEAEQENHAQTRESLTTALGDAVDLLKKDHPGTDVGAG